MSPAVYPLAGAGLTVASSIAFGTILLRGLGIRFHRVEQQAFAFITGSAALSMVVLALSAIHLARKGVFYGLAGFLIVLAYLGREKVVYKPLVAVPRWLPALSLAVAAPFVILYFFNALAPEVSPDGSTYHLGNVLRFWANHGLIPIRDMYGAFPEGLEMLFLFAFSIGRHSAAALVHFAFLLALPVLMICYSLRFGLPKAGFLGAVLVFVSPVIGRDGTVAYNDVALAAVMFGVFYLLEVWLEAKDNRLLVVAGLLAGFCVGIKYTGAIVFPYALYVFVTAAGDRRYRWRPLLIFAVFSIILVAPWLIKNAAYLQNPLAPFMNSYFPNPYFSPKFEADYLQSRSLFATPDSAREFALKYTVAGIGFLGPIFLLAPLALYSFRVRGGRLLIAAAIFVLPLLSNSDIRFLIPAVPCLALALANAVADTSFAVPALMLCHALFSWPVVAETYCDRYAWRLKDLNVRPALYKGAAEDYLHQQLGAAYDMARVMENIVPSGSRVFCFRCPAQAYSLTDFTVYYESLEAIAMSDVLWTPMQRARQPLKHLVLSFSRTRAKRLRVEQSSSKPDQAWSVAELRLIDEQHELQRSPLWRIRADPNPWEAPFAFDNSPVSKWSSERYGVAGAFLEVTLDQPAAVDSVVLECSENAPENLALWAEPKEGSGLSPVNVKLHTELVAAPTGMRRAAAQMLKNYGFSYLIIADGDYYADDYKKFAEYWGLRVVTRIGDWTLYHLE
jgi:hypothetical protein